MLQAECKDLQKKLEKSQKHLDSNDQMIRWLNNQVRNLLLSGIYHLGSVGKNIF